MDRLTYYRLRSPYPNDFTKLCSLTGIEIDNNFLTLEGRDVKTLSIDGNDIVITLYNGSKLRMTAPSLVGYTAGEGIDPVKLSNNIIETNALLSKITQNITVNGESIGSYNPGDIIPMGTPVETILRKLLNRVFDVIATSPSCTIRYTCNGSDVPSGTIMEVGTIMNNSTISTTYNDGEFSGEDGYTYSTQAGCIPQNTHYYKNGIELGGSPTSGTNPLTGYNFNYVDEQTYTFGCSVNYSDSTIIPVKSDGTSSSVRISAGTTSLATTNIKGSYKYFYGYIPTSPYAIYENIVTSQSDFVTLGLSSGWCVNNGTTRIDTMESVQNKTSLLLALPDKYRNITRTENSMYIPVVISEKWKQQTDSNGDPLTVSYTIGETTTTYYVYILHSLNPIRYNNIEFAQ